MNINLHIERLVLDNIDINIDNKNQLKAVVEVELKRLLEKRGTGSMLQLYSNQQSLKGNSISIKNNQNLTIFGNQIGSAIYGGIEK